MNCQTDLVGRYRALYPDAFAYEGDRGVILRETPDQAALRHVIALALTYHARKKGRQAGGVGRFPSPAFRATSSRWGEAGSAALRVVARYWPRASYSKATSPEMGSVTPRSPPRSSSMLRIPSRE